VNCLFRNGILKGLVSGVPAETVVLPPGWGATMQVARPHFVPRAPHPSHSTRHTTVRSFEHATSTKESTAWTRPRIPDGATPCHFPHVTTRFYRKSQHCQNELPSTLQRNADRFHSLLTCAVIVFNKPLCCLIHRHLKWSKPKVWEVTAQFTVTRRFLVLPV